MARRGRRAAAAAGEDEGRGGHEGGQGDGESALGHVDDGCPRLFPADFLAVKRSDAHCFQTSCRYARAVTSTPSDGVGASEASTAADAICAALRQRIITGEYAGGTRLTEEQVAADFQA